MRTKEMQLQNLTLSPEIHNRWAKMIQAGKFDEIRAKLSLMANSQDLAEIKPDSFDEIFRNDTPTLATVRAYQGEKKCRAAIKVCLIAVNEFFGSKSGLSDGQIEMLCDLIVSEYHFLTLADLKYCIRQGLMGRYEDKVFGKATPDVIMRWLRLHNEQRHEAGARKSMSEHGRLKKEESEARVTDDYALEQIRAINKAIQDKFGNGDSREKKTWKVRYSSIEQYCRDKDLNPVVFRCDLQEKWKKEYEEKGINPEQLSFELFCGVRENQILLEINDKNQ